MTSRIRACHDCRGIAEDGYSRCEPCRRARRPSDKARNKAIVSGAFPPASRAELLALLRKGVQFGDALRELELTQQLVHGYARRSEVFARSLDSALMKGRDKTLTHGTSGAYRNGRCRCPECRAYKKREW